MAYSNGKYPEIRPARPAFTVPLPAERCNTKLVELSETLAAHRFAIIVVRVGIRISYTRMSKLDLVD